MGGVFIKGVALGPVALTGCRSLIALFVLLPFVRLRDLAWNPLRYLTAVLYCLVVLTFVSSTKLTTAANAIVLQYTAPVYVALFSRLFLNEKITLFDWLCLAVSLLGMVLFFVGSLSTAGMLGNILAIASGIMFAALVISLRKQKDAKPLSSIVLGNLLTALVCVPFLLIPHSPIGTHGIIIIVCMGVFQLGLSYLAYSKAIRKVSAIDGIMIPIIEPILNPLWVFLFIGEKPTPWAFVGGFIVIGSVTFRSLYSLRAKPIVVFPT
jgi:drug/metabolite transporter (DMT)-like permease